MYRTLISVFLFFLLSGILSASPAEINFPDSVKSEKNKKASKHYIRPCIFLDSYSTQEQKLDTFNATGKKLETYQFKQSSVGFYAPVFTRSWFRKDSISIANFHLLIGGSLLSAKPVFSDLGNKHIITKASFGIRGIYNTGKGNLWFFQVAPFISQDKYTLSKPIGRYSSVFIYNRTVSERFSFRVGIMRTYLFGNGFETKRKRFGLHLPVIGFRVGRFDKVHLNVQLPRNISFEFSMSKNKKFWGSVFVKPFGGLYVLGNNDSLYNGSAPSILFGRYEFLSGFRFNYTPCNYFSLFVSVGKSANRSISFSAENKVEEKKGFFIPFYKEQLDNTGFINFGLSFRFGIIKKSTNDYALYDVFDLNSSYDLGDSNNGPSVNGEIPTAGNKEKTLKRIEYKDVQDLLDPADLY